jgi:epoxyqueuosine reductase
MPAIILAQAHSPAESGLSDMIGRDTRKLARQIKAWGEELGFEQVGIAGIELEEAERRLKTWLERGYHGSMRYMSKHGTKRTRPNELVPGTIRVITARMNYLPQHGGAAERVLAQGELAYIARYALGRDYHKVLRKRLQKLATRIEKRVGRLGYRVLVDSAPVMEKPLAQRAGLGWIGKHTNLINKNAGSWFVLGEIYTDLPLPEDEPASEHCGSCRACIDVCPTRAIVAPFVLDARRCISYLTIESTDGIPESLRTRIGNRVFGCDDCQLFCPWNKFARPSQEADFAPRHELDASQLTDLFAWNEETWQSRTAGSAIRRAGYAGWLRNLAVALGNAPSSPPVIAALRARCDHPAAMVREHVAWALKQHE